MSTTDWPASIVPAAVQWQLQKAGTQFTSPFNGTTQAVDYVAERWQVSLSLPAVRSAGAVAALLNNMAGGVNRVNLWHHGSGGQPAGTLRGAPTLGAGAARGDATLTLAGCTNANLLVYAGFELDSNSDGLADGWVLQTGGSTGTVTYSRGAGYGSPAMQQLAASALAVGAVIGARTTTFAVGAYAGKQVSYSFDVYGFNATTVLLEVLWYDAGGAFISLDQTSAALPGSWARRSATFTAPAYAAKAKVGLYINGGSGAAAYGNFDNVQLEIGAPTAYAQPATLLAGDMIGCSGHLLQVASDCVANDAGAITVPLVNRVRGAIAGGTAVTWYRPTAQFIMPAMVGGTMQVPGFTQGAALDLVEVY